MPLNLVPAILWIWWENPFDIEDSVNNKISLGIHLDLEFLGLPNHTTWVTPAQCSLG